MSLTARLKAIPQHLPHGTASRGIKGVLVDKGERYVGAYLMGAAKGYYGNRFIWKGHGADLWLGAGALVGSVLLNAFSGGRSGAADHLERLGDVGVMSALGSLGANMGLEKAGHTVAINQLPKKTVAGAVPPAKSGPFLSPQEIAAFAAKR